MKKVIAFILLALFAIPCLAADYPGYNYPWQNVTKSNSGTTLAIVTFEAAAHQNVVIDQIIAKSDADSPTITLSSRTRGASSFSTATTAMTLDLASTSSTTSFEVQEVPKNPQALTPLWVGDKGQAIEIKVDGSTDVDLVVISRLGTIFPENPSTIAGY